VKLRFHSLMTYSVWGVFLLSVIYSANFVIKMEPVLVVVNDFSLYYLAEMNFIFPNSILIHEIDSFTVHLKLYATIKTLVVSTNLNLVIIDRELTHGSSFTSKVIGDIELLSSYCTNQMNHTCESNLTFCRI